jgi:hypothetical protein
MNRIDDKGFARIAKSLDKDRDDLEITDMFYFSEKGEIYYFSDGIAAVRLYDALGGSEDSDAWLLLGPDGQPIADITQPEAEEAYTWHYYQAIEDFQNNPDKDMIRDYPSEEDRAQFDIATGTVDGDEDIFEVQKMKPNQESLPHL